MEIREESRIKFRFSDEVQVVKLDDTEFYRQCFNVFPGSKGVDFISVGKNMIAFIEVKNCTGDESNCRWRIFPNNKKKETSHTSVDVEGRDSLDIEIPQKVAMSLAALVGAKSFEETKDSAEELKAMQKAVCSDDFANDKKKKYVILFLEGNFATHTRTKKMIMSDLQRSMNNKMKWLNCRVSVVDSNTYDEKVFQIV